VAGLSPRDRLPPAPIDRLARPFLDFLHVEAASGIVLGACTLIALAAANSPWAGNWEAFWSTRIVLGFGALTLDYPLWYWVNDALMAVFFFVIGLEIKRELVVGELREPSARALPVAAALGGALLPAGIYLLIHHDGPAARAWGVPMATDIAFVVGALALFGRRVPPALKLFVLSLAIVDDLLAVTVIAVFYTSGVELALLGAAAGGFALMALLQRLGVRSIGVYGLLGAAIWLLTLKGGVHPTVAGVALGLLAPARPLLRPEQVAAALDRARAAILAGADAKSRAELVAHTSETLAEAVSPVRRLERALHPWVAFAIMPVFALANAGVPFSVGELAHPVALAIAVALVVGKPLGILAGAWLAVRLGWARLPEGADWRMVGAAGALAGIGFTMALFIASLGLPADFLVHGKTGVLLGSAVSAALGAWLLARTLPKHG
jgi:NhaA family Na+:H+ antiporter